MTIDPVEHVLSGSKKKMIWSMSKPVRAVTGAAALLGASLFSTVDHAATLTLDNFVLNGSAVPNPGGTGIRLTTDADHDDTPAINEGQTGSAGAQFSSGGTVEYNFTFQILPIPQPNNPGSYFGTADGFAFVLHTNGLNALGTGGSDLGYNGSFTNSIIVEFDTFTFNNSNYPPGYNTDSNGNTFFNEYPAPHIAVHRNGDAGVHEGNAMNANVEDFTNEAVWNAKLLFDENILTVSLAGVEVLTHDFGQSWRDLLGLGTDDAYNLSFTAATGSLGSYHDILSVSAEVGEITPVPLPAAAWLLLSGLGGVGAFARRRRARGEPAAAA